MKVSELSAFCQSTAKHIIYFIIRLSWLGCVVLLFSGSSIANQIISPDSSASATDNTSFSFVVWGHPRNSLGQPPLHFDEILERLSELKPDLIFVTGDVTEGGLKRYLDNNKIPLTEDLLEIIKKDWDRFDAALKKTGIPYYITPGNHDVYSVQSREMFYQRYPKLPFALTFKTSRFVLLEDMGVDNLGKKDFDFKGYAVPFGDEQMQFIRNELSLQENYRHLFFFMHNTNSWGPSQGFWWKDIHPMLRGGNTRAVFSANPDGYQFKYSYVIEDDIYYIQSCTFPGLSVRDTAKAEAARKALGMQPDNIQYVKVNGDDVKISTIVVGATSSNVRSRRFWEKVHAVESRENALPGPAFILKSKLFRVSDRIFMVIAVLFCVCLLFILIYKRLKRE